MAGRKQELKPDSRGSYRPRIGYLDQTKKQPRFNLGTNGDQAEYRYALIRQLYSENVAVNRQDFKRFGLDMPDRWMPTPLRFAKQIARGQINIILPQIPTEEPDEYVQRFRQFKSDFPSLHLMPFSKQFYDEGVRELERIEINYTNSLYDGLKRNGVIPAARKAPSRIIPGSLHEALDAYKLNINDTGDKLTDGKLKPSQRKRLEKAEKLRVHDDCPLSSLDFDNVERLIAYWRNRPPSKRVERIKRKTAKHHIDELVRFLRWLDVTDTYDWQLPRGFDRISRKIVTLPEDHEHRSLIEKAVYTPVEVRLLLSHAKEFDRMLLLVGLNCAFGAAEIGRLTEEEVWLDHDHKYKRKLDFKTTTDDSFIRVMRPKTRVFGEWLLWPETADSLRWGIERAKREGGTFIVCRAGGNPLYNENNANPQAAIAKRWRELVKRVQSHVSDFPYLPYGSLRDTIPDKLRHQNKTELASMCLAHGTPFKGDSLIECYGNKPYGRLHDSLRELRKFFVSDGKPSVA